MSQPAPEPRIPEDQAPTQGAVDPATPRALVRVRLAKVRVVRYAPDGGHAPREWAKAIASEHLPEPALRGVPIRLGLQVTKQRAVDVFIRLESASSLRARISAALKRTQTDKAFRSRKALRRQIPHADRPLAVLSAEVAGKPVRVLLARPRD